MKNKIDTNTQENNKKKIWTMVKILLVLTLFSMIIASLYSGDEDSTIGYNTAIIPINGIITTSSSEGLFDSEQAGSREIVATIEKVRNDPSIEAVIFEINSPGGSPVATDEISSAIKKLNDEGIVTVSVIRETGASGAYWISSSTNHIVANRMSIVGSIGVYGSYVEVAGLLNRYNMTYRRLVSGEYKDAASPLKQLSSAEEALIQGKLDLLHKEFIKAVAENRNITYESVEKLATGEIFLGLEAKDNGLIDELGGKEEAIKYIESNLNITVKTKEFSREKTFFETIASAMNKNSYYVGRGVASELKLENTFEITT
jgi:protease-4